MSNIFYVQYILTHRRVLPVYKTLTPYSIGGMIIIEQYISKTFIQTQVFSRRWDELGLDDECLRKLELEILKNPHKFPVMKGTGGLRKARVPIGKRGKSGGARVCFVDFVFAETVYFITVYTKKEKANLSKEECAAINKAIQVLEKSLGGGENGKE